MRFPSREQIERIKREYPAGCKVRLVHMDDPQSPPVGNEKFAFRCFVIRIGMVGAEYKKARKILLENLTGNSSWKNGAPEKATDVENPAEGSASTETVEETEVAINE